MPSPKAARRPKRVPRITHEAVEERYQRGKEFARAGRGAEALKEFLWCYDKGMIAVLSFSGVRVSFLLSAIAELGRAYPPAKDALRLRRDKVANTIASASRRSKALSDYASLNHYLDEDERTLALFDRIPRGDPRRLQMGSSVYELLIKAGRYPEAVEVYPYREMISLFLSVTKARIPPDFSEGERQELEARIRSHAVRRAGRDIEVLARAGKLRAARAFAARVVAFDRTPSARKMLREAAARAGRAGLLTEVLAAVPRTSSGRAALADIPGARRR